MRTRVAWTLTAAATLTLTACQSKQPTQEVTELPPPPAVEPQPVEAYEPVAADAAIANDPFAPGASGATGGPVLGYGGGGSYVIRRGDTLWSIAATRLGDGQRWRDIISANPGLIPERLPVGQSINLP